MRAGNPVKSALSHLPTYRALRAGEEDVGEELISMGRLFEHTSGTLTSRRLSLCRTAGSTGARRFRLSALRDPWPQRAHQLHSCRKPTGGKPQLRWVALTGCRWRDGASSRLPYKKGCPANSDVSPFVRVAVCSCRPTAALRARGSGHNPAGNDELPGSVESGARRQ